MNNCWMWKGARNHKRYGFSYRNVPKGKSVNLAHRQVYEILVGPIPADMTIDHLCRNPGCVNPEHLEVVTRLNNYLRGPWTSINRTHCPQGHEYTPENTKRIPSHPSYRYCRACHRVSSHVNRGSRKAG